MAESTNPRPRHELFGGPMDGDHRSSENEAIYYDSYDNKLVHMYAKTHRGYEWQGLVDYVDGTKVYVLKPGQRS